MRQVWSAGVGPMQRSLSSVQWGRHVRPLTIAVAVLICLGVIASTEYGVPHSESWRGAIFVLIGILATLWVAGTAQMVQEEIRDFLMERVNSRSQRTVAVIELCNCAVHEFRAVTFLPAVGVRDEPEHGPGEYLHAVEDALSRGVRVTLVSVSCDEAKAYCEGKDFGDDSCDALGWIGGRLTELSERFEETLDWITVPGEAITVNVCHNESAALMYHMGLECDDGDGFRSTDARILSVAKGGFSRYEEYHRAPGKSGLEAVAASL